MKQVELTPQILRLYAGQKFTIQYNGEGYSSMPHLRRLSSLTEDEARELFKISRGEEWDYQYNSSLANKERKNGKIWSCLENWWAGDYEMFDENGNWIIGDPTAWLYLLSKGFDLFGLIEAGLAKEVDK